MATSGHSQLPTQTTPRTTTQRDAQVIPVLHGLSTGSKSKKGKAKSSKRIPKRPLSAYNMFFRREQRRMINESTNDQKEIVGCSTNGKMGIAALARTVAARWKQLPAAQKAFCIDEARKDQLRYSGEMARCRKKVCSFSRSTPESAARKYCATSKRSRKSSLPTYTPQPSDSKRTDLTGVRLFPPNGIACSVGPPRDLLAKLFSELDSDEKDFLCSLTYPKT